MIKLADFNEIRQFIKKESAIDLDESKAYLVESRLAPVLMLHDLKDYSELISKLKKITERNLKTDVIDAMATNETLFFRDRAPFQMLKSHILPEIIGKNKASKSISIWSAACSSGQEPYSLAMMLQEDFPQLNTWNVQIYATDISKEVIEKAKIGTYTQLEIGRGLPTPYLLKFFDKDDSCYCIKNELKKRITFSEQNLIKHWRVPAPFDLVLIRNVLIYFDADTKKSIFNQLKKVLAPGGFMLLGSGETTLGITNDFERVQLEKGYCYQNPLK